MDQAQFDKRVAKLSEVIVQSCKADAHHEVIMAALLMTLVSGARSFKMPVEMLVKSFGKALEAAFEGVHMTEVTKNDPADLDSYDWDNAPRC